MNEELALLGLAIMDEMVRRKKAELECERLKSALQDSEKAAGLHVVHMEPEK